MPDSWGREPVNRFRQITVLRGMGVLIWEDKQAGILEDSVEMVRDAVMTFNEYKGMLRKENRENGEFGVQVWFMRPVVPSMGCLFLRPLPDGSLRVLHALLVRYTNKRKLALAMGLHASLGARSPIAILGADGLRVIFGK